eukprot:1157703-Pelagomonas_calceolata.AAC.3
MLCKIEIGPSSQGCNTTALSTNGAVVFEKCPVKSQSRKLWRLLLPHDGLGAYVGKTYKLEGSRNIKKKALLSTYMLSACGQCCKHLTSKAMLKICGNNKLANTNVRLDRKAAHTCHQVQRGSSESKQMLQVDSLLGRGTSPTPNKDALGMRTNRREVPTTSLFCEQDIVYTLPGNGPMVLIKGFGARGSQSFNVCNQYGDHMLQVKKGSQGMTRGALAAVGAKEKSFEADEDGVPCVQGLRVQAAPNY